MKQSLILILTGLLLASCQTTETAQKTATSALFQLSSYEREVGLKIKAESDFYEKSITAANQTVTDLWGNEQPFKLEREAESFWNANRNSNASQLDPKLVKLFQDSMKSWARRDAEYEQLLLQTRQSMNENRKNLEMETAKIKQLKAKLQLLSEPRSNDEMLKMMVAFGKAAQTHYAEISTNAQDASALSGGGD